MPYYNRHGGQFATLSMLVHFRGSCWHGSRSGLKAYFTSPCRWLYDQVEAHGIEPWSEALPLRVLLPRLSHSPPVYPIVPGRGDSLKAGIACAVCICATWGKTTTHATHTWAAMAWVIGATFVTLFTTCPPMATVFWCRYFLQWWVAILDRVSKVPAVRCRAILWI